MNYFNVDAGNLTSSTGDTMTHNNLCGKIKYNFIHIKQNNRGRKK